MKIGEMGDGVKLAVGMKNGCARDACGMRRLGKRNRNGGMKMIQMEWNHKDNEGGKVDIGFDLGQERRTAD